MQNYVILIPVVILISGFAFLGLIVTTTLALPLDFLDKTYVFGPITGLTQDNNGTTDWVLAGVWRASLPNATDTSSDTNSSSFNAAIEMIRPDGTGRHTHTVTDFTLLNSSESNTNTNSTFYNGTSTVSLAKGPALDIPTSIMLSNKSMISIWFDPESVDHHFGDSHTLFGIVASPEFDNSIVNSPLQGGPGNNTLDH
ncbi:MAG TPA: hypothetical protein VJL78_01470 [Candidatus Nitrosocosmicus sp.]|nr:hypothetical protein [Candidatus Nitrosocosmicus sp.]